RTLSFLNQIVKKESPNLIVYTGDIFQNINEIDFEATILKVFSIPISNQIPFAFTFGSNDIISSTNKEIILNYISNLPFSLTKKSINLDGSLSNYLLDISNGDAQIYILDSYQNKINHLQNDYIKILHDNNNKINKNYKNIDSPFSLAFFHYPIPEYRPKGPFSVVGQYNQKEKLITETSPETRKILGQFVNIVSVGHKHTNDCCILSSLPHDDDIWLCYNAAAGEGGYGNPQIAFSRKVRLFSLDKNKKKITSWKRAENNPDSIIDYQVLVNDGKVSS
ncbi:uncharacterized protein ASCRUDRAFT_31083, partial [Ascoidea rubescens DSM 1968]